MTTRKTPTKLTLKKSKSSVRSQRTTRGKASVEKGRNFEDAVADLYRLLGAKAIQNIEIHQKKVDILATFKVPGSTREHRVIVECKDEKKAVNANQRVQAFKGLLDVARMSGAADSAEIITRVAWSDQAKGFARTSGVELFTYAEKIAQLIDLTGYLKNLVSKFEKGDPARPGEPPLGAYYVDLSAEKLEKGKAKRIDVIDTLIHAWLRDSSVQNHLAIFGEYGSGKSSLCQRLSRDLAASYLRDPNSSRIPILLNLRDFIGKLDLEAYITSFLDRECKVTNPRIELFRAMNEAGIFLLIFDGFDEMAVKVDADTLESNLLEIEKLTGSKNARVLLTSRPEYFITTQEEKEALNPLVNPFLNRATRYEPIKILPWDEEQVELFLRRRVRLVTGAIQPWTYYRDKIKTIGSLSDLSQRPVLLDMIVKTLPTLIVSDAPINLPNLYRAYLIGEMKRQKILKKRTLLLSDDNRLGILQQLAIDIYAHKTSSLGFTGAQNYIEKEINPPKQELEAHTRDLLTNSFLIRTGDGYHFSHKSIMEYLVAAKLHSEIQSNEPDAFANLELDQVVLNFLKELSPNPETLMRWIRLTRRDRQRGPHFGGNAATLLCLLSTDSLAGKDLSDSDLTGARLNNADLRKTNLQRTNLRDADLAGAKFSALDLRSARLQNARVLYVVLGVGDSPEQSLSGVINTLLGERAEMTIFKGPGSLFGIAVRVKTKKDLEDYRVSLTSSSGGKVAVYFDDIQRLTGSQGFAVP